MSDATKVIVSYQGETLEKLIYRDPVPDLSELPRHFIAKYDDRANVVFQRIEYATDPDVVLWNALAREIGV